MRTHPVAVPAHAKGARLRRFIMTCFAANCRSEPISGEGERRPGERSASGTTRMHGPRGYRCSADRCSGRIYSAAALFMECGSVFVQIEQGVFGRSPVALNRRAAEWLGEAVG